MENERLNKLLAMEQAKPGDAFLKFAIAQEYVNAQNDALALPYFELLAERHADYVPLYYHLGKLYERNGAFNKAREIYGAGIGIAKTANDFKTAGELQEALILVEE